MRCSRYLGIVLALGMLLATCLPMGGCAAAGDRPDSLTNREQDVYAQIDAYVRSAVDADHIPALCLSIVDSDSALFSRAYGSGAATDTPFLIGSVSKSFTAVCIMQLAEEGAIDLDAPVSTWLPDLADADRISVRQLLHHTSGLGTYQTLANSHIVGEQGRHRYANVNYAILGRIIEAVTGQSYEAYVQEHVLAPLGLSHSAATRKVSEENGLVQGHTNVLGYNMERDPAYPASGNDWITVPAGYLSASVEDLGRYLQMYLRGGEDILTRASVDRMLYGDTVHVEDEEIPYWYGYGWNLIRDPLPQPVYRHAGLVETGASCVYLLPQSGIGVAITANVNDYFVGNDLLDELGWGVVLMLMDSAPNPVDADAYVTRHVELDLVLLAILVPGIVSCFLIGRSVRRMRQAKRVGNVIAWAAAHALLPALLLLLPQIAFGTPLWVVRDFVPDVFCALLVGATLLVGSGIIELALLRRAARQNQPDAQQGDGSAQDPVA